MASENKNDILLVIRAVDRVTKPIKEIREKIQNAFRPINALGKVLGKNLDFKGVSEKWSGVKEAAGRVGSEVTALVTKLTGVGLAAGAAFYGIVHGAMEAGDRLSEVASRVGLTADAFASLEYSASQADVGPEMFASSMDKLNKQLGDMTVGKGGEFLAFLNQISPTFAQQVKGAKSSEAALALLTDAFSKIDDPQRRASLAAHAFGKSNIQMAEWLKQGSAAIQGQQKHFIDLVGSQEGSAKAASDLDNATKDLGRAFFGAQNAIGSAFFPVLTELANKLAGFISDNRASLAAWAEKAAAAFKRWLDGGGLERLIATIGKIADVVGKVVDFLGPLGSLIAVVGVMALPTVAALAGLAGSLVSMGVALAPIIVAAGPILAVVAAVSALAYLGKVIYDNWGDIAFIFKDWGNSLRWAIIDTWDKVKPILDKLAVFMPGGSFAVSVGDALVNKMRPGSPAAAIGPAAGAVPPSASPAAPTESTVNVKFDNLPRGARVSSPDGDANVSVSAGYSMVTP